MTIDPAWLRRAVALAAGCDMPEAMATDLANTLSVRAEVLPWLVLRAQAFADDPAIAAAIKAQAARIARPRTSRPASLHSAVRSAEVKALADEVIRQIVAENVERARLGEEANGLLHLANESAAGLPHHDFSRHVGHVPPAGEDRN
jgi:hypothetical protein